MEKSTSPTSTIFLLGFLRIGIYINIYIYIWIHISETYRSKYPYWLKIKYSLHARFEHASKKTISAVGWSAGNPMKCPSTLPGFTSIPALSLQVTGTPINSVRSYLTIIFAHKLVMGSSSNYQKLCDVAKAFISALSDPILDIDRITFDYFSTESFFIHLTARYNGIINARYQSRPPKFVNLRFHTISVDFLKFQRTLRTVISCNSTGRNETQVLSTAIAIHISQIHKIYCNLKE